MRTSLLLPMALLALAVDATGGTAPAASAGITDEELTALFSPKDLVAADLIDDTTLAGNLAAAKADANFLKVSQELRRDYDTIQALPKAERNSADLDVRLRAVAFRTVVMDGAEFAKGSVYYAPPKAAAREKTDTKPSWSTFVFERALREAYPVLMAKMDADLKPQAQGGHREEILAGSTGLPATVVDHVTALEQSGRFQVNLIVSDERFTNKDGKKVAIALGWRNDLFRTEKKKEAKPAAAQPTAGAPAATADAPDDDAETAVDNDQGGEQGEGGEAQA